MQILFLDESGDHSLTKIDPQYPVFVLGGVIVELDYAKEQLEEKTRKFKRELFRDEDLILHTADICRNRNGFERLSDPHFRDRFYRELNDLMRNIECKVLACAIRKHEHVERYGDAAYDPYRLCLHIVTERFCFEIGAGSKGTIIAECRHDHVDHRLMDAWARLTENGTFYVQEAIGKRIGNLLLRPKQQNIAGLQLADLVVSPIGRHVIGKKAHEDFRIIEEKFRRVGGRSGYLGTGLVLLPG